MPRLQFFTINIVIVKLNQGLPNIKRKPTFLEANFSEVFVLRRAVPILSHAGALALVTEFFRVRCVTASHHIIMTSFEEAVLKAVVNGR